MLINAETKTVERQGKVSEKKTGVKKNMTCTASSMGVYKPN